MSGICWQEIVVIMITLHRPYVTQYIMFYFIELLSTYLFQTLYNALFVHIALNEDKDKDILTNSVQIVHCYPYLKILYELLTVAI